MNAARLSCIVYFLRKSYDRQAMKLTINSPLSHFRCGNQHAFAGVEWL